MQYTTNMKLKKPDYGDSADIADINSNMDVIDSHLADYTKLKGDMSTLKTTAKDNLPSIINELFQYANDGKTAVANAVTAKGVSASPSDTFPVLADKIGQIKTGMQVRFGTFSSSWNHVNRTKRLTINNLDFEPQMLIVRFPNFYTNGSYTYDYGNAVLSRIEEYPSLDGAGHYNRTNNDNCGVGIQAWNGNWWLPTGFDITINYYTTWSGSDGYSGSINWMAIG